ncbi:Uncharacterized protein Rs2_17842 [Raphanus sativus]|nr:Uncharacterized protein Rs2_17842 [Raphanus sativus]
MEEAAATIIATAERNLANSSVQIPPPMQRNITPNQSPAPLLAPPVILLQAPDQSHDLPQAIPDSPSEQEQDSHHRRRGISARLKSAIEVSTITTQEGMQLARHQQEQREHLVHPPSTL